MGNDQNVTMVDVVPKAPTGNGNYKEAVRKQLNRIVQDVLDRETRELTRLLNEERQKAISFLVDENKIAIQEMVEEGKKIIWARAQVPLMTDALGTNYLEDLIERVHDVVENDGASDTEELFTPVEPEIKVDRIEWTELEILPPRDQDEIEAINDHLNHLPEVVSVELITLVDKSIFRIRTSKKIDFVEVLSSLPQVLETKRVINGDHGKIQVTLQAKSKLARTQDDMNARVKKIFHGKK